MSKNTYDETYGLENRSEAKDLLADPGSYSQEDLDLLDNFYSENFSEEAMREDVMNALENSDGFENRDMQLLKLLQDYDYGGENIEEDCRVDVQGRKPGPI